MKYTFGLGVAALALTAMLASCASTAAPKAEEIPAAPAAVPTAPAAKEEPKAAPVVEAPAPKAEAAAPAPKAEPAPVAKEEPKAAPAVKELTLEEKIDAADSSITLNEAYEIAVALTDPANDPDGKLTGKALAKADEIVTSLIDHAMSEDEINSYIDLMNQGMAAYGDYVKALGIDVQPYFDLAEERKVGIEAYNKNSYYYYYKRYRKNAHYKQELMDLLKAKQEAEAAK